MNVDCEYCAHRNPPGVTSCTACGTPFHFLTRHPEEWKPEDYSQWLFAEHFQICDLVDKQGFESLTKPQQYNYLIGYLYYQVCNGGLWQYFLNPCGYDAPKLMVALQDIGAMPLADVISRCLDFFPERQPSEMFEERILRIDLIPDSISEQLDDEAAHLLFPEQASLKSDIIVLLKQKIDTLVA